MRARVAHDVGQHEGHAGELNAEQLEPLPLSPTLARDARHAVRSASMLVPITTSTSSPAMLKTRVGGSTPPRAFRVGKFPRQPRGPHRETTTRARRFAVGSRKYLSPEPLLQNPNWVMIQTYLGHQVPAYAYARNNPVSNTDPTGLGPPGSAVPCTPTDSTYSCCIKQNPGNPQKCTGGEEPIKDIPNLAQAACQRQLTECIISCESACDPPTGRLGQARAAICVSFCHIAYAVCVAKAPLPGAQ